MTRVRENTKKRIGGRIKGETLGVGTVVREGKGREGKGRKGSVDDETKSKAGRRTLGEIILDRKLQLKRINREGKGAGSTDAINRLGRLQIKSQPDRGNRIVADSQPGDFSATRTTPPPDTRTRHRDGLTQDKDDDGDEDNAAVPKRGSQARPRVSPVIPRTTFRCPDGSKGGYFADQETGCQVRK